MSAEKPDVDVSKYHHMPETECLLTLSWKDIVDQARRQNIDLTRDQAVEVFQKLYQRMPTEPIIDAYWTALEAELEDYL